MVYKQNESDKNPALPPMDHFRHLEDPEDAVSCKTFNSTFINGDEDPRYKCPEGDVSRGNQIHRIISRRKWSSGREACKGIFVKKQDELRSDIELAGTMGDRDSELYMRGVFERMLADEMGKDAAPVMEFVKVRRFLNFEGTPYFEFVYGDTSLFGEVKSGKSIA